MAETAVARVVITPPASEKMCNFVISFNLIKPTNIYGQQLAMRGDWDFLQDLCM